MIPIANIVSRSEALVIKSMLDAAGIVVVVSGEQHASVQLISLALGNYTLTVPDWQYDDACKVIGDTFANAEFSFSVGLQTAVLKLLAAQFAMYFTVIVLSAMKLGVLSISFILIPFVQILGTPVNPQGRSEYYLTSILD